MTWRKPINIVKHMRLAICSTGELYGGVEQFIYSFATEISKDQSVCLIVVLFHEGHLSNKLREAGVRIFVLTSFKYSLLTVSRLARLFRKEGIDIVHNNGYRANILCTIAAKACGLKVVKTEHGKIEPSKGLKRIKMTLNLLFDMLVSKSMVDRVVFVSKDMQSHSMRFYKSKKGKVIYNGIPRIEYAKVDRYNASNGKSFNIGIIGRLSEIKGHTYLLKAMSLLECVPGLKLNIYGSGSLEAELKDFCRQNALSDRVIFHGFRNDIYECLKSLDLLVMPSLHEGLPYTLLEAMYMKVPVVASDVGGLREILENGRDSNW